MKLLKILLVCILAFAGLAHAQAAPVFLYASEAAGTTPDTTTLVVNNTDTVACVFGTNPNGNIKCPLGQITTPGTYQLAVRVTVQPGTVVTATGGTTTPGGTAVSLPFSWTLNPSTVATPGNLKLGS